MDVSGWVWALTLLALCGVLITDLVIIGRRPHAPTLRESVVWSLVYVGLAAAFGLVVWAGYGADVRRGVLRRLAGGEEPFGRQSLRLHADPGPVRGPPAYQSRVLLIGIVLALIMRGAFIATGAVLTNRFGWIFYLFGAFLIYTAVKIAREGSHEPDEFKENPVIRWSRRILPVSGEYDRGRILTVVEGRRVVTPMLIVMIAIGTTDLIFAVDSIPAIFGVTREPYLIFTANAFALMGLRQLYFLIGGLLERLVYLSVGLGLVLGFVGAKMVLEALAENSLPFLNGGQPVSWAPHLPIWLSLTVIFTLLGGTTVASLWRSALDRRAALRARPNTATTEAPTTGTPTTEAVD